MKEIERLKNRLKRINGRNSLSIMIFVDDNEIMVQYFIEGAIPCKGVECFFNKNAVSGFITNLKEKYRIFSENCNIWEFINDLKEWEE